MSPRAVRLLTLAAVMLLAIVLVAGCGNTANPVPQLDRPAAPLTFKRLSYPAAGIGLSVPGNWTVATGRTPAVAVVSSGSAVISLWRYPRSTPVSPAGPAELAAKRRALLQSARRRASDLHLLASSMVTVDGRGAVVLDTLQRLQGRLRRVLSLHIYVPAGELVLEEYAPPPLFGVVDRSIFTPVRDSLKLLPGTSA